MPAIILLAATLDVVPTQLAQLAAALWVVAPDQTIALRPVKVASFGEVTAVLESGVAVGERIVVAGVHKLSAGEKIKAVDQLPKAPLVP